MSFKKLFSSSSTTSLNDDNAIKSTSSHRSFLKQKNSSSSISPKSSTPAAGATAASNRNNNHIKANNVHINNNSTSNHHHHGNSLMNNSPSINSISSHKEHHSLRRFLKKFKPRDSSSSSNNHSNNNARGNDRQIDMNIFAKYGLPGKLLGTGASGSVNLLTSKDDPNKIYAVKKFRAKLPNEQESDYKVKVYNEYQIAELLNHENLIKTYELIKDYKKNAPVADYYIVMEYCKFDFFNLVMSGLMETNEIYCYFKQLINGVYFLHNHGLAHRDLKLDNCVVNAYGILKIIDFGSAVHFKKEIPKGYFISESDIMLTPTMKLIPARGVVGLDPYLSPEVFDPHGYDPRGADVWSIAIIYCCMILKRFPWKLPKMSDPSYKSFAGPQQQQQQYSNDIEDELNNLTLDRHSHHPPIGPDRLLRLLPTDSRNLIKNMLALDPKKRYLMQDVIDDPFVQSVQVCSGNQCADSHSHHLVTEEELSKITQERERLKRLKDAGMA
ncbi:putative serine/threonine-protein kinase RTK1 [Candida viswanathii]|uniref:non-specific serine/threonine protein kinase n=1 Tax=Candida viswanathii TaxID=5486 RepID=A0A367XX48_9ASCO|nr:putative serine/threonine-protein kinase RTK1 [Candida viswanathii]